MIIGVASRAAGDSRDTAHAACGAPFVPRAVSAIAAQTARLACDARTAIVLGRLFGIEQWSACTPEVQPEIKTAPSAGQFAHPGALELAHPAGRIHVVFDLGEHPALAAAARRPRGNRASQASGERALRVAVAGVLLEPLIKRLEKLGLRGLRVASLEPEASSSGAQPSDTSRTPPIWLSFVLDGRRITSSVTLDATLLPVLESQLARHRADSRAALASATSADESLGHGSLANLLVPGRLVLGARPLSISTLEALASGDVLLRAISPGVAPLVSGTTSAARAVAWAAWGTPGLRRLYAQIEIDGNTLVITKEPSMSENLDPVPPDDALNADPNDDPIDVGELDLPVQFEVDTIALPLSQVYSLRAGYVLELANPVRDVQVKLVTHGRTIGYGELVSVGEHLGVRILRMAHGDGPAQ